VNKLGSQKPEKQRGSFLSSILTAAANGVLRTAVDGCTMPSTAEDRDRTRANVAQISLTMSTTIDGMRMLLIAAAHLQCLIFETIPCIHTCWIMVDRRGRGL